MQRRFEWLYSEREKAIGDFQSPDHLDNSTSSQDLPERFLPWTAFTKPSKMNQHDQAKKQFENVIKNDLNRWFMESDLDAQDLA